MFIKNDKNEVLKLIFFSLIRALFRDELIPKQTAIVGYARSALSIDDLINNISKHIKLKNKKEEDKFKEFVKYNVYLQGSYDKVEDFIKLDRIVKQLENGKKSNRLFYLALPPTVFEPVTKLIHDQCLIKE